MVWGWQHRLEKVLAAARDQARAQNVSRVMTLSALQNASKAPSKSQLLDVLEQKITSGELGITYKIISPDTKAVIAEYQSALDIPSSIYDESAGHEIVIDPLSDIEIVFRVGLND
jgi:hypothetical protein